MRSSLYSYVKALTGLTSAFLLVVVFGCVTSPTGRNQLILFSSEQMDVMGAQSFAQLKSQSPASGDVVEGAYVTCIANALVASLDPSQLAALLSGLRGAGRLREMRRGGDVYLAPTEGTYVDPTP